MRTKLVSLVVLTHAALCPLLLWVNTHKTKAVLGPQSFIYIFSEHWSAFMSKDHQRLHFSYNDDNSWGIDYLKDYANLTTFEVRNTTRPVTNSAHAITSNPTINGTVKGNINLFKHLATGAQTLDVTAYNTLQFDIQNNTEVEIILMPKTPVLWTNRYKYTIPANAGITDYKIAFTDFKNAKGSAFTYKDVRTVVFSIINDYTTVVPFSLKLSDVNLNHYQQVTTLHKDLKDKLTVTNAPNPFHGFTIFELPVATKFAVITCYDTSGRTVDSKTIKTMNKELQFEYHALDLKNGMYFYQILTETGIRLTGNFIIK